MTRPSFRGLSLLGFLACAGGLAFALFLQHVKDYEPCPMCIFQRIAMLGAGVLFLLGALHGPRGGGRWVYALLAAAAAAAGGINAARQVWLQSLPADQVPSCGPTLDYLLKIMPLQKVVVYMFKGEGSCAKIDAQWLGIALPQWTLLAFIGLVLWALAMPVLTRRS